MSCDVEQFFQAATIEESLCGMVFPAVFDPNPLPVETEGEERPEPPPTAGDTEAGRVAVLPRPIPTWLIPIWFGQQLPPGSNSHIPSPTDPAEEEPSGLQLGIENAAPKYKRHARAQIARRESQAGTPNGDASVPATPALFQRATGAAATKSAVGLLALASCLLLAL